MTLEQLRVFVAVAERQHVTQAARVLNLAQSAASSAIAALESRHDTKLFDRVGRHIELTEAGQAFLVEARSVLSLRTKVSVAGKRNFAGRDKGVETAPEDQGDHRRDMTHASNPANSALLAQSWEISVCEKVRGGAERTRTACQARSRYRTGLSRVIHRGNSAL